MTAPLTLPGRMLMIGCGNMGGAMLDRWLASGLDPASVTVVSPSGRAMPAGVEVVRAIPEEGGHDLVVLALKPQQLGTLRNVSLGSPRSVMSILAGVEVASLTLIWPEATIVRAMPNLPVRIGRGVTALFSESTDGDARSTAEALARPLGLVEWIDKEASFDAVTALAGCGPGFVFRFADALAAAGAALGLPANQAMRLALATLEGSAVMAAAAEDLPSTLADRVASPGGSTREGLKVLDRDDALVALMTRTLEASARRNAEMAAAAR